MEKLEDVDLAEIITEATQEDKTNRMEDVDQEEGHLWLLQIIDPVPIEEGKILKTKACLTIF